MKRLRRTWAVPTLLAVNLAVFACEVVLSPNALAAFESFFALSAKGLAAGRLWQLETHTFLHANWWHLAINMAILWMAGRPVERIVGAARFLRLYAVCAGAGGLTQLALGPRDTILIGASGAIFGVVIALCTMVPNATLVVWPFFGRWVRVRAKYLAWGMMVSTVLFLVTGFEQWIGHPAHLGGALAGYLEIRLAGFGSPTLVERWFHRRGGY